MKNMNNEYLDKEIPIELVAPINLDDYFVNDDNKRITDIMLMVLEKIKNKKIPIYIGEYYYKELYGMENINIVNKIKKD